MMSPPRTLLLAVAALTASVLGHGHVRRVLVNGVEYPGFERYKLGDQSNAVTWYFTTEDEGPVPMSAINGPDIVCHLGATNAQSAVPVAAGGRLEIVRFNTRGGFQHPGPEMHYLAPCGDAGCANVDKNNLRFFKIYERGLVQGGMADSPDWVTQRWATTEIHKNVRTEGEGFVDAYTVNIPANIRPGGYVLRHELLGLHMAHEGITEFYPQCINIEVSGSGTQLPDGVRAAEMYHSGDPGVAVDIWVNLQSYQIPGPALSGVALKREAPRHNIHSHHNRVHSLKRHPRQLKPAAI
ncbi:glycoside hydrolase family 61 protein [Hypoxylon sp. CI-4A]|nr:glycoside hydrolase family 61 protein [Hypoxylon sp. CI-4A]